MDNENRYISSVTLIITEDHLNPEEISAMLNLMPSRSWKKGDLKNFEGGREFIYPWGGWKLFLDDSIMNSSLDDQILYWCRLLREKKQAISQIRSSSCAIILECYISIEESASLFIKNEILCELGEIGVELNFEFYKMNV